MSKCQNAQKNTKIIEHFYDIAHLDKMLYIKQLQVRKQDEVIQNHLINELINSKITICYRIYKPCIFASHR